MNLKIIMKKNNKSITAFFGKLGVLFFAGIAGPSILFSILFVAGAFLFLEYSMFDYFYTITESIGIGLLITVLINGFVIGLGSITIHLHEKYLM